MSTSPESQRRRPKILYSFPHTLGNPGIGTTAAHQVQELIALGFDRSCLLHQQSCGPKRCYKCRADPGPSQSPCAAPGHGSQECLQISRPSGCAGTTPTSWSSRPGACMACGMPTHLPDRFTSRRDRGARGLQPSHRICLSGGWRSGPRRGRQASPFRCAPYSARILKQDARRMITPIFLLCHQNMYGNHSLFAAIQRVS